MHGTGQNTYWPAVFPGQRTQTVGKARTDQNSLGMDGKAKGFSHKQRFPK